MQQLAHWQQEDHGALSIQIGQDEVRLAPMLIGGWHLSGTGFSWVSDRFDEIVGICQFYEGYLLRKDARRGGEVVSFEEDLGDGFRLTANSSPRGRFEVRIKLGDTVVGRYDGFQNSATATFVLGEDTIQGAEMLEDVARRKGFGDKMRNAAERVTGLKAVPHGRNFTAGSLSQDAAKSWDRRAADRNVLGYGKDLATKMRTRMVELCRNRLQKMEEASLDLVHALAMAEKTQCDLMIGFIDDRPVCGWGVIKGIPIDPSGIMDRNKLRESASAFCRRGETVRFKQMTFRKTDATIKRNWREEVTSDEREYADRIAALIASFPALQPKTKVERAEPAGGGMRP
jgi:hypothetical protein